MGIFPVQVKSVPHLLVAVAITVAGVGWLWRWWPVPECPFHHYLGVSCPMCGSTRASFALLSGHATEAFRFNPIFWYWIFWCVVAYLDVWTGAFSERRPTWGTRWLRVAWGNRWALAAQVLLLVGTVIYLNWPSRPA